MTRSGPSALDMGSALSVFSPGEEADRTNQTRTPHERTGEQISMRSAKHRSAVEYCVTNDLI